MWAEICNMVKPPYITDCQKEEITKEEFLKEMLLQKAVYKKIKKEFKQWQRKEKRRKRHKIFTFIFYAALVICACLGIILGMLASLSN